MVKPNKQTQGGSADGSTGPGSKKQQKASKLPSEEEIAAKRAVRAAKKAEEEQRAKQKEEELRAAALGLGEDDGGEALSKNERGEKLFVPRRWREVPAPPMEKQAESSRKERRVRVLSWNMLAQGLVRRKLFPGSDCLKMADREAGLSAELLAHRWDIGCFQEVDRTDIHFATLERGACAYRYEKGYSQKQHGLMIAWRTQPRLITDDQGNKRQGVAFHKEPVDSKIVFLDDVDADAFLSEESRTRRRQDRQGLSEAAEKAAKRASSRQTRNIALMVALRFVDGDDGACENDGRPSRPKGIIVATTHLFWHPMHAYERVRQAGIILRELDHFRNSREAWRDWEIVLAGDFNDQPHSATYHFLTDQKLTQHCMDEIKSSSVVHQTIDARVEREAGPSAAGNGAPAVGTEAAHTPGKEEIVADG